MSEADKIVFDYRRMIIMWLGIGIVTLTALFVSGLLYACLIMSSEIEDEI